MSFPDIQRVLVTLARTVEGVAAAGTETPADLQQRLPFVRVARIGGPRTSTLDSPTVDVDVFASTYAVGQSLAGRVSDLFLSAPHVAGGALIDTAASITGPVEVPWADPGVRRFLATYRFTLRPARS